MAGYMAWLAQERELHFSDYAALWSWSITDLESFWQSVWDYFDIQSPTPHEKVLKERSMPGARWFEGATVNYVDQVFRHSTAARDALIFEDETGRTIRLSWAELEREVASLAASFRGLGIAPGDRIEHSRDHCRLPGHCQRRRNLVGMLARYGTGERA
jgi:acetoacetyl-CoA synthetase